MTHRMLLVAAQVVSLAVSLSLFDGVNTKVGGSLLLVSFFCFGAYVGLLARDFVEGGE